jgi:hypothetical protein
MAAPGKQVQAVRVKPVALAVLVELAERVELVERAGRE